jgi:hypothetical protein
LDDLKPATRIGRFVVQGHRDGATLEGQEAAGKLDCARAGIEVAEIAFKGRHRDGFDVAVKCPVQGTGLDKVISLRALAMRVDVPQFRGSHAGLPHRGLHGSHQTGSTGPIGKARSVTTGGNAQHLGVDFCSTADGVIVSFDNEGGPTLTHNRPVPIEIERPARTFGVLRARQPVEQAELGDADRVNV